MSLPTSRTPISLADRYIVDTGASDSITEDNEDGLRAYALAQRKQVNSFAKDFKDTIPLRQGNSALPPKHIVAAYRLSEAR